jgi:transcriptional regulator with XRE-family HTH domain
MYTEAALRERIGSNLRHRRAMLGLTTKKAAERALMTWRRWQQIEAGETDTYVSTLARMAEAVGMDIAELMKPPPPVPLK